MIPAATAIQTERVYYTNTYLDKLEARVVEVGSDHKGAYVCFDKTIFHPQGGGQPNDQGTFHIGERSWQVTDLTTDGAIKHYYKEGQTQAPLINDVALLQIDLQRRTLLARLHSAGHLLECAMASICPDLVPFKGCHFPKGEASTYFYLADGKSMPNLQEVKVNLATLINHLVQKSIPVIANNDQKGRTVCFQGFEPLGCGGTHVRISTEIGNVDIRSVKREKVQVERDKPKQEGCKIGYDVT